MAVPMRRANPVTMLVVIESKTDPGLVAMKVQDALEDAGAKGVSVTLCTSDAIVMPIGQYKGTPLGQVPAEYLDHIIGESWIRDYPLVMAYIQSNLTRIHNELS